MQFSKHLRNICDCQAGCSPDTRWIFDVPVFLTACQWGALGAMEELFKQSGNTLDLSQGLHFAISMKGGRAELVQWLLDAKAGVDVPYQVPPAMSVFGIFFAIFSLQHRLGNITPTSNLCYHSEGRSPLITAFMAGSYEAAAVLISEGARLDAITARGLTALDFVQGQSSPDFLIDAFNGDDSGCRRVSSLAQTVSVKY